MEILVKPIRVRHFDPARLALLAAALCTLSAAAAPSLAAGVYSEDAVKAAFLYRFAGYVEWPSTAASSEPFTIAVLRADAVAEELQRFLPGRLVGGRAVRVRVIKSIQELDDAQMLYIGPALQDSLHSLLARLGKRAVLVVTDDEHGLARGGMINFISVDRRIRFEVSLLASDRAGLKISAELLSVAARVEGGRLRSEAGCESNAEMDEKGLFCLSTVAAR
jgi:uncharacterized protein DUF4154